jgi:transcriptional regulator with XRE-family HTH domain
MTLKQYLNHHNLSLKAFGNLCGLSAPTVLRVRDGLHMPSRRTLDAIVTATNGEIPIQDLITTPKIESSGIK